MDKAEKILNRKTFIREEMEKSLPEKQCDELWQLAAGKLAEILSRYSSLPKGVRIHTDNFIFPSAAIYLTVREAVGNEAAFGMIENAAVTHCVPMGRKLSGLMKVPGLPGLFIRIWDPMTKKVFGPGNGFRNVFYPKRKDEFRMDVTACPYCRYFGELGCTELTKIFCENDDRIYGNLPGLIFERTGTLGKGAERCDFLIRKI